MSLAPGTRIGPYEILAPLGRGGMGEVWRARDTKLRREVAIKALPAEFAADIERRARFEREAHLLASLNHPNVAAIYGLEEAGDAVYLVLELVEGETLAEKLVSGPLPVAETLAIAAQILAGLDAAHEAGVIHRDLKPSNVKVRPDGSVKVLDLGLARVIDPAAAPTDASQSPTVTTGGTRAGVILGTAAYMSPEQARGRPLDRRTDIFSFGCVFFECLTGRLAFPGETVSDTLAAILTAEPTWSALPRSAPPRLHSLLRRCLQKDPKRRLRDAADARLEIEDILSGPGSSSGEAASAAVRGWAGRRPLARGAALLLLGAVAALLLQRALAPLPRSSAATAIRSTLPLPAHTQLTVARTRPSMVFSPKGTLLVFSASRDGVTQLWLRALDRAEAVPIPGTENGFNPFFSPDGEWLAFFTWNELKKISLSGGAPVSICHVSPVTEGGAWAPDGYIYFTQINSGLYRVSAAGGVYEPFTTPDEKKGEHAHVWPQLLPGGQRLLVIIRSGKDFQDVGVSNLGILSLKDGSRRTLLQGVTFGQYAAPGFIVFVRGRAILAAPFDAARADLTGEPFPLVANPLMANQDATAYFAVSPAGILTYASGVAAAPPTNIPVWVDRAGRETPLPLPPKWYAEPRLSPDGKLLAVIADEGARAGIQIYDIERNVLSPLVPEPGRTFNPTWSPDGRRIAFTLFLAKTPRLCWRATDGSGPVQNLTAGDEPEFPGSFSPDGRTLAFTRVAREGGFLSMNLWLMALGDSKPEARPWLQGSFKQYSPMFSPDGGRIAYVSEESGHSEVYVRPYPGPAGKVKVSSEGGDEPAWSRDGRDLFYRIGEKLMAVRIETSPSFAVSAPRAVLTGDWVRGGTEGDPRAYDVAPDGNRFIFLKPVPQKKEEPVTELQMVVDWPAALARAPAGK